ncbi:MAG: T9SS type A sorting domain-containing protein [Bacteroidales bacterium]|nr:T9SS type A sorting domain-containing protein [Bacteroidales bacterium]MEA4840775.1 T9SS type A sorting domain-containing protein [Bacteroidales bacterium]
MKKLITLIFVGLALSLSSFASTYLIYKSSGGGTWTNTGGIASPVLVNLSTINGGNEASLNAWFADRSLATPTMGGGSKFVPGDQVWIIGGTYVLTDTVKLSDGVSLYGGFLGTESALSGRAKGTNAWDFTNETILDGNAATVGLLGDSTTVATIIDGLSIQNCKNSTSGVLGAAAKISGITTIMQNCIIKNCTTTMTTATSAGGIVLLGGATLKDCYIHDNTTSGYGAGVTTFSNGCKINGCKITNNTGVWGGGVCLYSTTSGVTVSNCDISNNTTTTKSGGGLLLYSTAVINADSITISNCTFNSNKSTAGSGGGLYASTKIGNIVNVSNCTFTSNTSGVGKSTTAGGGGLWTGVGTYHINNCTFENNTTTASSGGAIMVTPNPSGSVTISSSKFTGNSSFIHGSAFMFTGSAKANNCLIYGNIGGNSAYVSANAGIHGTFNNCTFASNPNTAGTAYVGIYLSTPTVANGSNADFTNCLFYNGGAKPINVDPAGGVVTYPTVTYCGFDTTATAMDTTYKDASNIFNVYASTYFNAANNDFHLAVGSPAIDAGTSIDNEYSTDLAGHNRPYGYYDMGAYEYDATYTNIPEAKKDQNDVTVYRNSDNMIAINCNADANAKISVSVYNLTGAKLLTQQITNSTTVLNKEFGSGIYLVCVQSDKKTIVQKIMIK